MRKELILNLRKRKYSGLIKVAKIKELWENFCFKDSKLLDGNPTKVEARFLSSKTGLNPGKGHFNFGLNSIHDGFSKVQKWEITNVDNKENQEERRGMTPLELLGNKHKTEYFPLLI